MHPKSNDKGPYKRKAQRILKHTYRKDTDGHRNWSVEVSSQGMPATTRKLDTANNWFPPRLSAHTLISIFSLQNCERVHFYGFKPSACGYLIQHSQENDAPITKLSHLKVLIQLNKNLSFERSSFTIESMKNILYSILNVLIH